MSKKMVKRSLALGALMAFVITGQVWASTLYSGAEALNDAVKDGKVTITVTDRNHVYMASSTAEEVVADLYVTTNEKPISVKKGSTTIVGVTNNRSVSLNGNVFYDIESTNLEDYYHVAYVTGKSTFTQNGNIKITATDVANNVRAIKAVRIGEGSNAVLEGNIDVSLKNMSVERLQIVTVVDGSTITHNGNVSLYAEDVENSYNKADCPAGYWVEYNKDASTLNGDIEMTFINKENGKGLLKNVYGVAVKDAVFNHNGNITISVGGDVSNLISDESDIKTIYGYVESGTGKYNQTGDGIKTLSFGAVDDQGNSVPFISSKDNALKWNFANFDVVKVTEGSVLYIDENQGDEPATDNGDFVIGANQDSVVDNNLISSLGGNFDLAEKSLIIEDGASVSVENMNVDKAEVIVGAGAELSVKEELVGNTTIKVESEDSRVSVGSASGNVEVQGSGALADKIAAGEVSIEDLANTVKDKDGNTIVSKVSTEEGLVAGAMSATVDEKGEIAPVVQKVNQKAAKVSKAGTNLKAHYRAHMNDMNKRMGELRMANGEAGVWTRMVRGENEYQGAKSQYNQYQLGYDEKLSVDKRWTVGAAVTFAEGDGSYGQGSTEDKSTAFAIYGSKLNNDGTFVDLIARYAHLESDLEDSVYGKGDYNTNGMSVSAEFGKRIQQGNGLWIEPQVEFTYGTVDSANFAFDRADVHFDSMDSFIARAGFAMGKDIKQGNIYARASYLYDFDGETTTIIGSGTTPIEDDFGGGWWEVGVGANINLSKATYIYADVEKTFGGEVDTNWQWNLGVRYSF